MTDTTTQDLGELLGLIVHDLRNPAATIGANASYIQEAVADPASAAESADALADLQAALGDLMMGLDQLSWISRSLARDKVALISDGDVMTAIRAAAIKSRGRAVIVLPADGPPIMAKGGGTLQRLLEVLLGNAYQHARKGAITVSARKADRSVIIEVSDEGRAVSPELRSAAFTLRGQAQLKGRADGRYGRVAGLLSARILAEAMGATVEADGADGQAVFRVHLTAL